MSGKTKKWGYLAHAQAGSPYKNKNTRTPTTKTAPAGQEKFQGVNNG